MAAYVIGLLQVEDWSWYKEYRNIVEPLIHKHGGRYLSKGIEFSYLEGQQTPTSAVVMLEFPSQEHVARWYADPDYAPMIALRQRSAITQLLTVQGLPDRQSKP